ncbi:uncharacterized protein LOC108227559 isoform X1 [Daucus carota subsp. sativus]|uniref:uncharacterized protein LOC108227559 isoform X1 n=1 Tax=Daucus carota subsp. sativus TaxID=79200 RepID=UPI0007EF1B8B|nr:PREDICTED: uncharacterized protein LOC108227559 isoform X1 [Daucus carota subsp. sativus]
MEALYSKLHEKYTHLKTKKFTETEELNRNQEEKFMAFTKASDELLEQYRIENDRLMAENDDLRCELASTRSRMDDKIAEYQKLLMEENHKKRELLQEIERLQSLQREGLCCISRFEKHEKPSSPERSQAGSDLVDKLASSKRKFSTSGASTETIDTQCGVGELDQAALGNSTDRSSKRSRFSEKLLESDQPKCCKQKTSLSGMSLGGEENVPGTTICMFQELVECLVGMKVSIVTKADETCISAVHQSSGYSFSLTWMKNSQGDDELLYRVLSLGTIESIAPEWMKEILMFNTKMCPVFFERMSRVVKLY